ncbi:FHIPEP family protein, partial [Vibrio parahaemolyticus VPTS-2010]
ATPLRAW